MRNVTITLDDETARWARIEAAKADTSVSRFVGDLLRHEMQMRASYRSARSRYLGRAVGYRSDGAEYPSRDDVHSR